MLQHCIAHDIILWPRCKCRPPMNCLLIYKSPESSLLLLLFIEDAKQQATDRKRLHTLRYSTLERQMLIFISEIPLCLNASLFDSYLGENTNTHWHRFWFWFRAHCVLTVVKCLFVFFSSFFSVLFHSGINFQESPRMFHIYHYFASHHLSAI